MNVKQFNLWNYDYAYSIQKCLNEYDIILSILINDG